MDQQVEVLRARLGEITERCQQIQGAPTDPVADPPRGPRPPSLKLCLKSSRPWSSASCKPESASPTSAAAARRDRAKPPYRRRHAGRRRSALRSASAMRPDRRPVRGPVRGWCRIRRSSRTRSVRSASTRSPLYVGVSSSPAHADKGGVPAELAALQQDVQTLQQFVPIDLGTLGGRYSVSLGDERQRPGRRLQHHAPATTSPAFSWTQAGGMVDLGTLGGSPVRPWR